MKRMTRLLCMLMLLVLLPLTAQAGHPDEATFNKYCKNRMISSSTLYKGTLVTNEDGIAYETKYNFEPIGTLPAGKYVSILYTHDGKSEVFYWDGGRKCAWVDVGTYAYATRTIYATNGKKTSIPALAWGDEAVVREILGEFLSAEDVQSYIDGMKQGLAGEKDENGEIVIIKQEPLTPPVITLQQGEGEAPEVQLVLPGVARSTIKLDGEQRIVPTADLHWELDGAEHALAVVYAPRSGIASLYARDDGRGGVIKKLKTGTVVLVMGQSGKYTKVFGENTVGYVITSALEFHDPCAEAAERTVKTKTNLRLAARDNGRKLIELPADAAVMVISQSGKWSLVEYEGFVGYMETRRLEQ